MDIQLLEPIAWSKSASVLLLYRLARHATAMAGFFARDDDHCHTVRTIAYWRRFSEDGVENAEPLTATVNVDQRLLQMSTNPEIEQWRIRAREYRRLAAQSTSKTSQKTLEDLAVEADEMADALENLE